MRSLGTRPTAGAWIMDNEEYDGNEEIQGVCARKQETRRSYAAENR